MRRGPPRMVTALRHREPDLWYRREPVALGGEALVQLQFQALALVLVAVVVGFQPSQGALAKQRVRDC